MKILITGNLGYVGSSLIPIIKKRMTHTKLFGFDTGYFSHLLAPANIPPELNLQAQYFDLILIKAWHWKVHFENFCYQ